MSPIIDFTNCANGYRDYGGSDNKISIEYESKKYMLKLPEILEKKNEFQTSHINNVISEYVGSHIIATTGLPVHNTTLGIYKNNIAVACEDFTGNGYKLQEFSWMMRSMYDKSEIMRIPAYPQLYEVMKGHPLLKDIAQQAIARYWDTFVMDALVGNFDRHKGNWGYLVNEETKDVITAPIYDCGSSLYPGLSEEKMREVLNSRELIEERIYVFPKPALNKMNSKKDNKFGYLELLSSGMDVNCTKALLRMYPKIDMNKIQNVVENTPFISDQRIEFYTKMVTYRKELILDKSIEILYLKEYEDKARNVLRLLNENAMVKSSHIQVCQGTFELAITPNKHDEARIYVNLDNFDCTVCVNDKVISDFDCVIYHKELSDMTRLIETYGEREKDVDRDKFDLSIEK